MATKSQGISVRLDADLQPAVKKWLQQHPGFSMSRLTNLALRGFVSTNQVLEAIQITPASKKEIKSSVKKLMKKHKKTLDELK